MASYSWFYSYGCRFYVNVDIDLQTSSSATSTDEKANSNDGDGQQADGKLIEEEELATGTVFSKCVTFTINLF